MGSSGLEPPTLRLSGARSNHLSYEPARSRHSLPALGLFSFLPGVPPLPIQLTPDSFLLFHYCLLIVYGGEEIRTPDPLLAGQMLYQLSYTPVAN